ncbi:DNA/RNA non-specific endonuclease, partial [Pseudalkalibacillus sp. R45]
MKKKVNGLILLLMAIFIVGCTNGEDPSTADKETELKVEAAENTDTKSETEKTATEVADEPDTEELEAEETSTETKDDRFSGYERLEVDGGDLSGHREPNVVVDIGFGDREYWAFTNEHGQLVRVIADEIILQDDSTEPVSSSGRYYSDEAKVPGVESAILDEGHIIADSLGGVSNAYN